MKKFVLKIVKVISPLLFVLFIYIFLDPCHVIWRYGEYPEFKSNNAAFNTYKLLTQEDSISYNSFIVGSSRSLCWPWEEWEKYLAPSAKAFHLDQSGDGLCLAIERLTFIYNNVEKVDNVLLIVDHEFLKKITPSAGIQFRNPWQMKPQKDYIEFQLAALKFSFSRVGIQSYFRLGKEYRFILPSYYDERHELHWIGREWAIQCDPNYYYKHIAGQQGDYFELHQRDTIEHISETIIKEEHIKLLSDIYHLFINGNTNYKIVISPLYDQLKLNPQDKAKLDSIFGEGNVFDFSGINELTRDSLNYYEASHYRPHVSKRIMEIIYSTKEDNQY